MTIEDALKELTPDPNGTPISLSTETAQFLVAEIKRMQQTLDDNSEDFACLGLPHGSVMEQLLVARDQVRKLTEEAKRDISTNRTPNAALPPLGTGPKRKMMIEIDVSEDFEKRLDNQWEVEREIHADRWTWRWATRRLKKTARHENVVVQTSPRLSKLHDIEQAIDAKQ